MCDVGKKFRLLKNYRNRTRRYGILCLRTGVLIVVLIVSSLHYISIEYESMDGFLECYLILYKR